MLAAIYCSDAFMMQGCRCVDGWRCLCKCQSEFNKIKGQGGEITHSYKCQNMKAHTEDMFQLLDSHLIV